MKIPFRRNESGAAAVEFALVSPILATILIGIGVYGTQILAYNKMRQAVAAGAEYAMTVDDDTTAIHDVVVSAWDDPASDAAVSAVQACYCDSTVSDCSTNCLDGSYSKRYITITATGTFSGIGGATKAMSVAQQIRTR